MKNMKIQGVVRGKKVITTNPDALQVCPDDRVNREFKAEYPNQLWISDFTYVSTWQGMVYIAFVIDPSIGSVGDSYDNAMAESIIGLFKTEVIKFMAPWKLVNKVEWETCKWVHWYNSKRLHSALDYNTPNEMEKKNYNDFKLTQKIV